LPATRKNTLKFVQFAGNALALSETRAARTHYWRKWKITLTDIAQLQIGKIMRGHLAGAQ